jgi:hypothetical protein
MASYQPQQSVLYPHSGQRHTECMRNIDAWQRSQSMASAQTVGLGGASIGLAMGLGSVGRRTAEDSGVVDGRSAMRGLYGRVRYNIDECLIRRGRAPDAQ